MDAYQDLFSGLDNVETLYLNGEFSAKKIDSSYFNGLVKVNKLVITNRTTTINDYLYLDARTLENFKFLEDLYIYRFVIPETFIWASSLKHLEFDWKLTKIMKILEFQ